MMQLLWSDQERQLLHRAQLSRQQQQRQLLQLQQQEIQMQMQQRTTVRHRPVPHQADAARSIAVQGPMGAADVPPSLWQQQVIANAISVLKSRSERGLLDITVPTKKTDVSPPPAPLGCIDGRGPSSRVPPPPHDDALGRRPRSEIQARAIDECVDGGGKRRRIVDGGDAMEPPPPCIARGITSHDSNFAGMTQDDVARLYNGIRARFAMKSDVSARGTTPRMMEYSRAARRASAA